MLLLPWIIFVICSFFNRLTNSEDDSGSATIVTNLAVVAERDFRGVDYKYLVKKVKQIIRNVTYNQLSHAELSFSFFTIDDIHLDKDTTALMSIMSCYNTWKLFRRFQHDNLLHLAITEADCPRLSSREGITVPLVAKNRVTSQLVLDVKMSILASWTTSILLYDDSIDVEVMKGIIMGLSSIIPGREDSTATISVYKVNNSRIEWERRRSVTKVLEDLPVNRLGSNFVVSVSHELIGVVMEVCKRVGLSEPVNQWFYLVPDANSINSNMSAYISLLNEGENIAFAQNTTTNSSKCKGGLFCHIEELLQSFVLSLDLLAQEEEAMIGQVSPEEWDVIRPSKLERRSKLLDSIRTYLSERGRCDNCTMWTFKSGDTWGLEYQEQEQKDSGRKIARQLVTVGIWTPREGIKMSDHLFPHVRHGFAGRNLPIVSFNNPPWQIIRYNESGENVEFKGFVFQIVDQLAQSLNFSYTVMFPANNKDGWTNDSSILKDYEGNTTHAYLETDKIIEILRQKRVFLAAGAFTVTERRKELVNFTMPISIQASSLLTARPGEVSRALIFMAPFTYDTWICIVVLIVIITPVLRYFHCHSPYYKYYYKNGVQGGLNTLFKCLWYVYGALMQQGGTYLPEADSGRILIGSWWLVVLVIVTSYGGNLVAFLTFPKYKIAITNIEELMARKGTVSWGLLKDTSIEHHLREQDYPKYKELYEGAIVHDEQNAEMVTKVRSGSHVFIEWKLNLLNLMKKEFLATNSCDFALGEEDFLEEQVAMMMQFGSPYLKLVNRELRRMHQSGLMYKWYLEHLPRKDRCWSTSRIMEATTHTVNLDDMQGSFFVLGLGCACAVVLICLELCYHKHKLSKEKKVVKPFVT